MLSRIPVKTAEEIELMREPCRITAQILFEVGSIIKPGITTEDINLFVHNRTMELGATPSQLGYRGFQKSVCTSVNDVVCHGVPSPFVTLQAGDIINVDVTSFKNGFHGDASRMFYVGGEDACSAEAKHLVETAKKAMEAGIKVVRPNAKVGDIGAAIMELVDKTGKNYGIVREYTGHGVGRQFHEPPQVVHIGRKGFGDTLKAGMTFTVEPMINGGTWKTVLSKVDGWTVRTADGKLSAQWEETVLVTEKGVEVLTVF